MTPPESQHDDVLALLDAYLDDELSADERLAVDALLDRSAEARAELADIARVRSLVRGLPPVDAPFGFFERLTRRRRRAPGVVFAAVGAVAAAIVLIVAVTPIVDRVAPPVDDLAERHALLASSTGELPAGYEPMAMEDDDEPLPPAEADGYTRMAAYEAPDGVHLVYALGASSVSVFEQRGRLAWDDLPDGGQRVSVGGDDAWTTATSATRTDDAPAVIGSIMVLQRDDMVVTIVGSMSPTDARDLADAMPSPSMPSVVDRVGEACTWVAEGFGFPE